MLILAGLALILLVTLATGFFVAQEFAYVAADRERLRALAEADDRPARRALRVSDRLSFTLSGSQLGITITGLLAGYVAEPFIGQGLAAPLRALGVPAPASLTVAVAIAVAVATVIQMVLGELAPKNLAIAKPETLARALAGPTLGYLAVTGWLIRVFDAASNRLLRAAGIEPIEHLPQGATPEDLDRIIARSHADGLLDTDTYHLLDRGLGFRTLTAAEAMVPRVDVIALASDAPATRVVEAMDTGHTRFPVTGESIDDVIGVVSVGDVASLDPHTRADTPVRALCSPPVMVTALAPLPLALDRLRRERQQLACVIDEYGGLAGIITLEDIAEELVGDIRDEDDPPGRAPATRPDGSWQVPGQWRLDEIAEATGVTLPQNPAYDTVSGLVMAYLGRVPTVGDQVTVALPPALGDDGEPAERRQATLEVLAVARHVPASVALRLGDPQRQPRPPETRP